MPLCMHCKNSTLVNKTQFICELDEPDIYIYEIDDDFDGPCEGYVCMDCYNTKE